MELTGRLRDLQMDYITKSPLITLIVNEDLVGIDELQGKELNIKLTRKCQKRSLDANAYFHVLVDKLRQKIGISFARCKNDLITSYGQIEYLDNQPLIYKTNAAPEYMREQESVHMEFIKKGDDGAYWYKAYRGTHTYDSAEMHQLIEGTIQDCQLYGIETATPEEIMRMEQLWSQRYGRMA